MSRDATLTLALEAELHAAFVAEAEARRLPAAELLRTLVRDFVERRDEHAAWFRAEVEAALREADDPTQRRIAHEEIAGGWRKQRAALSRRAGSGAPEG